MAVVTRWAGRALVTAAAVGAVGLLVAAASVEASRTFPQPEQQTLVPLVGAALLLASATARPTVHARVVQWSLWASGAAWLLPSLVAGTETWHQAAIVVGIGAATGPSALGWVAVLAGAVVPMTGWGGQASAAAVFIALAVVATARHRALAATAAGLLGIGLAAFWGWSRADPAGWEPDQALIVYELLLVVVALLLGIGSRVAQARLPQLQSRLVEDAAGGMDGLVNLLRGYLRDPTLRVEAVGAPGFTVYDGDREVAVISGRSPALDDPATREAVAFAVRMVALSEERRRALDRHTADLDQARVRLMAAVDAERAATADRLRESVVAPIQRISAGLATLDGAEGVGPALDLLAQSVDDVRATALGLAPRALGTGGLAAALSELARRSPVPCSLAVGPDVVGDQASEAALFYACSEALTNVAKHARAGRIEVSVRRVAEDLELEVTDDGIGGADPAGAGLRGLADRLERIDGRLRVESPPGAGTSLVATAPLRASRSGSTAGS